MLANIPIDFLPLWLLFALTVAVVLVSLEAGYRLGWYRHQQSDKEKESSVGAMVAPTLGLLSFLLAFTFGLAASRFEERRNVLLAEVNAVRTCYLRAGLLPEPQRAEIRKLLREYTDARLEAVQVGKLEHALQLSEELHGRLWVQATALAAKDSRSTFGRLFIKSLNDVINLHLKRLTVTIRSRIPGTIWAALYIITVLSMAAMGYHAGLTGTIRPLSTGAVALAFSVVMLLIADLDRPQEGMLNVSQQPMIDLQKSMKN